MKNYTITVNGTAYAVSVEENKLKDLIYHNFIIEIDIE